MTNMDKRLRMKELSRLIEQQETDNKTAQQILSKNQRVCEGYKKELSELRESMASKSADVGVSDHALLRYFERKYNVDIEQMRKEILTPLVRDAIKLGATSIQVEGFSFKVQEQTITTII